MDIQKALDANTPAKTPKNRAFAAILILLLTVTSLGSYYYFTRTIDDDTPPSLQLPSGGYQGYISEKKTQFREFNQEDIDKYQAPAGSKEVFKATEGTLYGFTEKDTTLGEIAEKSIVPTKKTAIMVGIWNPKINKFNTTEHNISNWQNSTLINPKTQIKAGHGFFILTNKPNLEIYNFKAGDTIPETQVDLGTLKQGWNLVALDPKTRMETLAAYKGSIKSVWVLKDPVHFEKVTNYTTQEGFSADTQKYSLTWIRFTTIPTKNTDTGESVLDTTNPKQDIVATDAKTNSDSATVTFKVTAPEFSSIKVNYGDITATIKVDGNSLSSDNLNINIKKTSENTYEAEIKNLKSDTKYDVGISVILPENKESIPSTITITTEKETEVMPAPIVEKEQGQNLIKLTIKPQTGEDTAKIKGYLVTYTNKDTGKTEEVMIDFSDPSQTTKKDASISQDNTNKTAGVETYPQDGTYEIKVTTVDKSNAQGKSANIQAEITPPIQVNISTNEGDEGNSDGFLTTGENTFLTLTISPPKQVTLDTICVAALTGNFSNITVQLNGSSISGTETTDSSCVKKLTNINKEIPSGDNKITILAIVAEGTKEAKLEISDIKFKENVTTPIASLYPGGTLTSPELQNPPKEEE